MSEIKLFKYIPDDENFFNKCCNILDGFDEKVSEYNQEKITYTLRFKKNTQKILFLISYGKKDLNVAMIEIMENMTTPFYPMI